MLRIVRPAAICSVAAALGLAAFHVSGGAHGSAGTTPSDTPLESFSLGVGYDLAQLELLETTLYHVEETYVEPERIDYEKMYVAALEAVERRVPVCMFRREPGGQLLHLEVGDYRSVLEVESIDSRRSLQRELRKVSSILKEHLDADDLVSDSSSTNNPYATVEYTLINGVLSTLDPHSVLLPPIDSKEMDVENQGEFGGLGITIVDREGQLTIEYPLKDTPAEKAGLQSDDHIVRIDGENC